MLSEQAIMVLAEELGTLLTAPDEFDRIYLRLVDNDTALVMQAHRGERDCGFRFHGTENLDLQLALDCIRGYFRRREIN